MNDTHLVEITLSSNAIDSLNEDPYEYVAGDVTIDGVLLEGAGVRLKGKIGSFRTLEEKAAFLLDFERFEPGQEFLGMEKLALNNMVQDPTMIREWMGYRHLREAGVIAPRSAHVQVLLNDELLGLYAHIETYDQRVWMDEQFPSTHQLFEEHLGADLSLVQPVEIGQPEGVLEPVGKYATLDMSATLKVLDLTQPRLGDLFNNWGR